MQYLHTVGGGMHLYFTLTPLNLFHEQPIKAEKKNNKHDVVTIMDQTAAPV